jgi:KDO2-lipid IV(A) lauroyltransferase
LGYAGRGLGLTLFHLRFRRKVVLSNLHLALGHELSEKEIQALARNIYCNIGITFLEIARNFALTGQEMRDEVLITDEDRRYFKTCIDRGRGIVFISGHIANWELLAMSVAAHGFPSAIVVKKMTSPISQFLIERQRKKTGLEVIYSGGTIEKMKTVLREGRVIGFMMDQNKTGKKGIRANFFGVPASSIRGLSKLIKETGAAVIPICSFRQPDGTLRVQTLAELPYLTADTVSDPDEKMLREEWLNAQQYQTAIESMVRMHPEQWLWIHRRWKADRTPLSFETAHLENR